MEDVFYLSEDMVDWETGVKLWLGEIVSSMFTRILSYG